MKFSEILIVYLACGSPFAVNFLLGVRGNRSMYVNLSAAIVLFLWPAKLVLHLIRVTNRAFISEKDSYETGTWDPISRRKAHDLRSSLERLLFPNGRSSDMLEFREIAERYSGLAFAKSDLDRKRALERNELPMIAGHPNPRLADICINRRNERRLMAHFAASREDLFTALSESIRASQRSRQITAVTEKLAELLGDIDLADQIRTLTPAPLELDERSKALQV